MKVGNLRLNVSRKFIIAWLCLACFMHNFLMNGANNVIMSSLQKEFYLSSQDTGVYVSVYDVGSLLSSIVISFASARGSKPRWIAFGMAMLFVGCMICVSPHFLRLGRKVTTSASNIDDMDFVVSNENAIELCNETVYYDVDGRAISLNSSSTMNGQGQDYSSTTEPSQG
jgi:hypothetical protein